MNIFTDKFKVISISCILFVSGFSSLIYQVIWQRILSQEIGIDWIAVSIVVAIFMTGIGFGSIVGGKITKLYNNKLLIIYGIIELVIGFYGLLSNQIIRAGNGIISEILVPNPFSDLLVNLFLLILPVFLMGVSTPLLIDSLKKIF